MNARDRVAATTVRSSLYSFRRITPDGRMLLPPKTEKAQPEYRGGFPLHRPLNTTDEISPAYAKAYQRARSIQAPTQALKRGYSHAVAVRPDPSEYVTKLVQQTRASEIGLLR